MIKKSMIAISIAFIIIGCVSSNSGKVVRVDPKETIDSDANYGVEDLHLFVHKMVGSMLQSPAINVKPKKYIGLGKIKIASGVDEHIDTLLIKNSIRTNLIKSRKINFIDTEHRRKLNRRRLFAKDFLLTGDIHAIKKDNQKGVDNFYALTLILTDVKTSKIVWSEEKEIRKIVDR
jgi:PBP1b-binding outer membrane lipoprotein LpoB